MVVAVAVVLALVGVSDGEDWEGRGVIYPVSQDDPEGDREEASARHEWCSFRVRHLDQPFAEDPRHDSYNTIHSRHDTKHAAQARPRLVDPTFVKFSHHPALKSRVH